MSSGNKYLDATLKRVGKPFKEATSFNREAESVLAANTKKWAAKLKTGKKQSGDNRPHTTD